jgi:predicted RNA-binding protein with RPS1 domain
MPRWRWNRRIRGPACVASQVSLAKFEGSFGHAVGEIHEIDTVHHIQEIQKKNKWIVDVRRATDEEDKLGIDVVVTLDYGVVGLQVKSSEKAARKFRQQHPEIPVAVWREDSKTYSKLLRDVLKCIRQSLQKPKNT